MKFVDKKKLPLTKNPKHKTINLHGVLTISLNNVRFRAYHGLYPEERQKGNDFVVNMQIRYIPQQEIITDLRQTINYATLFDIVNAIMQKPVDLLETLVQTIAKSVHEQFPQIKEVNVSVEKLNPPIDNFTGSTEVRYSVEF